MQKVILGTNALEPKTWTEHSVLSVDAFLRETFPQGLPETARIYKGSVNLLNDITPKCEKEIECMNSVDETVYVVVYPGDPITIIVAVVVAVVSVVASLLLAPKIPNVSQRNNQNQSSNNELSSRGNKSRIGARIPDIFGQVRSYPDLIAVPYKVFVANIEYETTYMCVGRGEYLIEDIREGSTIMSTIQGSKVAFYGPDTSPNIGTAQLAIGSPIGDPLLDIKRIEAFNGQVLKATNTSNRSYSSWLKFSNNGTTQKLLIDPSVLNTGRSYGYYDYEYEDYEEDDYYTNPIFSAGDIIEITDDLYAGVYTIGYVNGAEMQLLNATTVNSNWSSLSGTTAQDNTATVSKQNPDAVGEYLSDKKDADTFIVNVVALNGLYKEDADRQIAASIQYRITITPVNLSDVATGPAEVFTNTIRGSSSEKTSIGQTFYCKPSFVGRCKISAVRLTANDTAFDGNVVDEIKIRDVYAAKRVADGVHFGNVTTVHSQIKATDGALAVKDRKLSALVTRKLPVKLSNNTFDENDLQPTRSFADILCFNALDPFIGRRSINQIDVQNIYDTEQEIIDYFEDTENAIEGENFTRFAYTFDADNMSFEETASIICGTVHVTPYRKWNLIKTIFERQEDNPSMVFSHRNKLPGTETRAYKFGIYNEHDGVELTYVSPIDDALMTIKVPNDLITNPKKVQTVGVRNSRQAYVHAWRTWNKLIYNYLSTQFEATGEGNVLKRQDHILVSDNTNPVTFDGEILEQAGLSLKLSQNVELEENLTYYIAVQHTNRTVQIVECSSSSMGKNYVQLVTPLTFKLAFEDDLYSRSAFKISEESLVSVDRFIVSENRINSNMSSDVKAINYDARYYQNDSLSNNAPELDVSSPFEPEPPYVPPTPEPEPDPVPDQPEPDPTPEPEPEPDPPPSPPGRNPREPDYIFDPSNPNENIQ